MGCRKERHQPSIGGAESEQGEAVYQLDRMQGNGEDGKDTVSLHELTN